jgi:hypothetical protein
MGLGGNDLSQREEGRGLLVGKRERGKEGKMRDVDCSDVWVLRK